MKSFDLIVIGAGPAGFAAAMRGLDLGKKVALIERKEPGGAGVFDGVLSSKSWWELARETEQTRVQMEAHGWPFPGYTFSELNAKVNQAVTQRTQILTQQIQLMCATYPARFRYLKGEGAFVSPHDIEVSSAEGKEIIQGDYVVLATGSRPRYLPNIAIDEKHILSSDGIHHLAEYPESLVILGAGVIGCEFAAIFAMLGRTKVYLIDKESRILPFEDEDLSAVVEKNLESRGVVIHRNSQIKTMVVKEGRVEYTLAFADGSLQTFNVEKALVAVGRVPNTEKLNLHAADVHKGPRGHITDTDTQTNVPHIYAVGDLTHDLALANVGEVEGRHAVEKMFGFAQHNMVYDNISTIMFLCPEVAGVGMNETEAKRLGIRYRAVRLQYKFIPRAIAMGITDGFQKILVTDDEDMFVLGMRAIGEHASSAIQAVALMIRHGIRVSALTELIHPHPSITEGVQECARALMGSAVTKGDGIEVWRG